jgi:hypothetical protein
LFFFQSGGSRLGEELWASKAAHNFVGCSDATNGFAGTRALLATILFFSFRIRLVFASDD